MLKLLYREKKKWNSIFVKPLKELVVEYRDSISFEHIGFPENWVELLEYIEPTTSDIND
jgi:abortive infection bacteriophage resistance protein